jgi:prepilin-type N-terminal cleavage/methylation domain-containing protein
MRSLHDVRPSLECAQITAAGHGLNVDRRAFSLMELIVVIAVAVLLAGLMMPAMKHVRENAHRVICMSNMQQVGQGVILYGGDFKDRLPFSENVQSAPTLANLQNLMAARKPGPGLGWDGLGLLYSENYCTASDCFYCPSHQGNHPPERYAASWRSRNSNGAIFTNFHYAGHRDWEKDRPRTLNDGHEMVLATDGLRTARDFNHLSGMNVLRGDCSVRWREDVDQLYEVLPRDDNDPPSADYSSIWDVVVAGN